MSKAKDQEPFKAPPVEPVPTVEPDSVDASGAILVRSQHGLMIDPYTETRFEGEVHVPSITSWMQSQIDAGKLVVVDPPLAG